MEFTFASRRSPVYATRGMVASSQPLASQAGLSLLMSGDNAVDAAVATAAALNVAEPSSTGIGGDMFALYYDAATKKVSAINGSGRSPAKLSLSLLREQGLIPSFPLYHVHTATVPGAVAGWCDLLERFGNKPMKDVLAPAIRMADDGVPISPITAEGWARSRELLASQPGGEQMLIDGRAPQAGEIFRNRNLAESLRVIAEGGKQAFYCGDIGRRIVEVLRSAGSVMSEDDLAAHHSTWEEPISTVYRGIRVHECPPNGQGLVALLTLNILSELGCGSEDGTSPERLHRVIEALRLAFADTAWYVADPAHVQIPLEALLSRRYAKERAALVDVERATMNRRRGAPVAGSDTVYFCVVDGQGNACSFINSNYMGFGTGIAPAGCGFTLQNRGHNFSLEEGHPNALAPRKRPYHTIIPGLAVRESDGSLFAPFGVMGGFMQPQGHVQVLLAMIEDGLDPQSAVDRPRIYLEQARPDSDVLIEDGMPEATIAQLQRMGHPVRMVRSWDRNIFGRGQIIGRDPQTGVLCAGSDPRGDGCAMGF